MFNLEHNRKKKLPLSARKLRLAVHVGITQPARCTHDMVCIDSLQQASIGFPNYFWLTETNTAADSACLGPGNTQLVFW